MLVTVVALAVVFFASRGGKSDDRVSASASTTSSGRRIAAGRELGSTTAHDLSGPGDRARRDGRADPAAAASATVAAVATTADADDGDAHDHGEAEADDDCEAEAHHDRDDVADHDRARHRAARDARRRTSAPVDPGETTIAVHVQDGRGTFHRYDNTDPQWGERPCAHRTLPKGTVVTVVNVKTGASTWCIVKDRGPYGNAIIDLDEEQFVEIAPVGAGIINVRITW